MEKETLEEVKDLTYWRKNAEEDYIKVPISVLRYITELEERRYSEEEVIAFAQWMYDYKGDINKVEELLKEFKKK